MAYDGKSILGRNGVDSQFVLLMQILIHYKTEGVRKEILEELLFGDREVKNVNHALHSVIYNARKKLENEGVPKVQYIEIKDGVVKWTDDIPVWEDARAFEKLYEKATGEKEQNRKLELLREAISLYTGEFIPKCAGEVWVAAESRRYQNIFDCCVKTAADLYRRQNAYEKMERLGKYASRVEPFSDWEAITMEAMIAMGRYEESRQLYTETADRYLAGRGLHPSRKLKELMAELEKRMVHSYAALDSIQERLEEPKKQKTAGAYLCTYPIFVGVYQHTVRLISRSGKPACLMLCTITDSRENPMKEGPQLERMAERLEKAICQSVRKGDAVTRYSRGQYLMLLTDITEERCKRIQRRINDRFLTDRQRTGVRYDVKNV